MNQLPFSKPGRFWKGTLHTHSTRSDGKLSPERVCQTYRELGYDFLAITDHFLKNYNYPLTDTSSFSTPDFATLPGAELHAYQTATGELWHILAVGLPLDFAQPAADETGPQLAARALETGAFVAAAHPAWYDLTEDDLISLGPIHAIEIFNGVAADHNDCAESWSILDAMLVRGYRYSGCATDDAHFDPRLHDVGRGWVWVKSESLSPKSLLDALKAGHYYSSTGPQIHDLEVQLNNKLSVRCSPASSIMVKGKGSNFRHCHGNGMMDAEISLRGFNSPYCRVIVRDSQGGRAWSNPIWLTV
jgi:hypothetical protein